MSKDEQLSDNVSALRMLGEMGIIDPLSAAFGVARVYLYKGLDAMTEEQRFIFDQQVAPILLHKCGRCDDYIQVSTLPEAYEHGSMLCSRHLPQPKGD